MVIHRTLRTLIVAAALALTTVSICVDPLASADDPKLPEAPTFKPGRIIRGADGQITFDESEAGRTTVVCPPDSGAADCDHRDLRTALARAGHGAVVVLRAGRYPQAGILRADGVTIRGEPGAHLVDTAAEGKAALVIKGNDTTVETLECSGLRVRDGNGACIRQEGRNLTLRRVHFHDSQEGLLTSRDVGRIVIEDSRFERLGHGGRAHGVYIGAAEALEVRRSTFLASKGEGHEIKSRARRTLIEDSIVASLDGRDSYLIDIPYGGSVTIRGNVLQEGPNSANWGILAFGLEGLPYPENHALVEDNTVIVDRHPSRLFRSRIEVTFRDNVVVGNLSVPPGNTHYRTRREAGLPPAPAIPQNPIP